MAVAAEVVDCPKLDPRLLDIAAREKVVGPCDSRRDEPWVERDGAIDGAVRGVEIPVKPARIR
jgi:hypothetical protein